MTHRHTADKFAQGQPEANGVDRVHILSAVPSSYCKQSLSESLVEKMRESLPTFLKNNIRYVAVAMIWTVILMLSASIYGSNSDNATGIIIVGLICATFFSMFALSDEFSDSKTAAAERETHQGKRKNDETRDIDPVSLLTQEDVDELRAEVKAQMRQRLLNGAEGELGSLDALLADHDKSLRGK